MDGQTHPLVRAVMLQRARAGLGLIAHIPAGYNGSPTPHDFRAFAIDDDQLRSWKATWKRRGIPTSAVDADALERELTS